MSPATTRQQRDDRAQKVIQWQECLTTLPDSIFFELMRMYLGEIKSPFNKQNLIERLGSFLHKEQVKENILLLLSQQDCQIISAIALLEHPTQEVLLSFFAGSLSLSELQDKLMNLEERLVIFRNTSNLLPKQQPPFAINPILEPLLEQRIQPAYLLPLPQEFQSQREENPLPYLTPSLLAAIFSFSKSNPNLCRQNGTLTKRIVQRLPQVFPFDLTNGTMDFFQTLITSLQNLSLIKEGSKGYEPDYQRWLAFAELPFNLQIAYLVAAACGRDTRSNLQKKAGILLSMINLCPPEGFTQDTFQRLEFLIQNIRLNLPNQGGTASHSGSSRIGVSRGTRFAQMMEAAEKKRLAKDTPSPEKSTDEEEEFQPTQQIVLESAPENSSHWCKSLFEAGLRLGIFRQTGTGYGIKNTLQPVYHPHIEQIHPPVPERGHLTLDSSLAATLLPGLNLQQMLPLTQFMEVKRFDTAMTLEINKESCLAYFDQGKNPKHIEEVLSRYAIHGIPQNLSVSLEDWHHSYGMATLYKGYVLHIKEKKDISKHPILAGHIVLQLEEGVYLMNFTNDQEAQEILAKGGFENTGSIKRAPLPPTQSTFAPVTPKLPLQEFLAIYPDNRINWENQQELQNQHLSQMEEKLEAMALPPHQKEGLQFRLNRKILLLPEQMQGESVKKEQFEASGMDFVGKVHVTEQAIQCKNNLQLTYLQQNQEKRIVLGLPVEIQKIQGDCLVTLQLEENPTPLTCSLGQAQDVKRIRGSIFSSTS